MFAAALGCNLAWGLVDAVMYLVRTAAERGRLLTLMRSVQAAPDAETGRTIIERSLSRVTASLVSSVEVEAMRKRVVAPSGENYTSVIAAADRGPLHLEARYNYESIGARSAFAGWTFSGGEAIAWELTPLLGGAWGTTQALVPGLEVSVAWGKLDFYSETEYVRSSERTDRYFYAWSELGFRPVEWLRVGAAGQRTKVYGGERDIQRGPFGQVTWGPLTIGGYWFNPGSSNQIFVGSIAATF